MLLVGLANRLFGLSRLVGDTFFVAASQTRDHDVGWPFCPGSDPAGNARDPEGPAFSAEF